VADTLTGKLALVTGGNRNIGRAIALALAAGGSDVVITYRERKESAEQTVTALRELGVRACALQVDLSGSAELTPLVADVMKQASVWGHDGLDILINNAGTLRLGMFDAITEEDLDAVYATNFKSVFLLTQLLLPHLRDGGRIVNLGSGTARIAFGPLVSYGPLKAAVQSLTSYMAALLGPRAITVNAVAPGGLDDDFNAPLFAAMPQAPDFIRSNTAVGRIGVPGDVGAVVAFLCTPAAGFISGATIPIDGGYHL
jgi:NAD(P)-dependent dehydrogenase (short-subunit alcohol dehydrogenase family)